jgi:hypothetical protein
MTIKSILFILLSAAMITACGRKDDKTNGNVPTDVTQQSETVATFKYYKGGFFPPPNQPNWSNDMTITFTTSGFFIDARDPDPLSARAGTFSQSQAAELFNLVSQLIVSVKAPGGPQVADAGVEYVEITLQNGQVKKYHLMNMEVPVGELFAVNPADLHNYLQALEASLPTVCQ